ncbi:MAG: UDP-N-acetylmuramoyl-L-alanyl-D-glutamate--2,6-diaminopimelate ligase [Fusobacteriaceae bacterium]|jgi:UDP-N-acetylmuramoyl-L-alanyl-D-glutamate--2,6-diaminopimelate ligase|nr:UDP-N-acetylmuramoyl-L-alanyl-D-glutamate--2,6-diaminopimelate ligase [Fusobacteriaceae bacterium]
MEAYLQGIRHKNLNAAPFPAAYRHMHHDSRKIGPGDVFVALTGEVSDGHDFIADAIDRGAVCVLVSREVPAEVPAPVIYVENLRENLGEIASRFYGWPQRELTIIGFTGTKGKTSSTYFLEKILGPENVARIGTIEYKVGNDIEEANNTTPESVDIVRICRKAADRHIPWLVMEVSSHALALGRVSMLSFDVAVFTNLKQDHLDFHKDMEDYFLAKKKLFGMLKKKKNAVINIDDPYGSRLYEEYPGISYGISGGDVTGRILKIRRDGQDVEISVFGDVARFATKLPGRYNLYNMLGVVGAAKLLDVDDKKIFETLGQLNGAPGRFELVSAKCGFTVVVDYSHTEDALFNILKSLNEIRLKKIITVFGCGGDRDRTKRPKMGRVAEEWSDTVIVTSDNPRTEDPKAIIAEITSGLRKENHLVIEDREQAIMKAIALAEKDDIVLIAGKGHETYQIFGHEKYHFDDREIANREIILKKKAQ